MRAALVLLAVLCALPVWAWPQAPDSSPRPQARPAPAPVAVSPATARPAPFIVTVRATALAPRHSPRPEPRGHAPDTPVSPATAFPAAPGTRAAAAVVARSAAAERPGAMRVIPHSPKPQIRPDGLERAVRAAATRATPARVAQAGRHGQLCGRPGIVGDELPPITGATSGCGIAAPVRVRTIDGITLSQPATLNCTTARTLQDWLGQRAVRTVGTAGGGISSLRVVASYACRTRNNRPGARLSEHARGNAIDIAGIGLANGQELSVLRDWRRGRAGRILQQLHRDACGPFGTVLGPNADRFHRDHFHFDTARHRTGPHCR